MTLPPLPKPTQIRSYGYPYAQGYTEAQMLALQRETVEACAARLMEMHRIAYGSHNFYHHAALELRSMTK